MVKLLGVEMKVQRLSLHGCIGQAEDEGNLMRGAPAVRGKPCQPSAHPQAGLG
ncbi:hypothetical protein [Pseudorhodoferax sp. Leaf267]|uniref:hypothetical protein n=1 Tax=Pseudorhodoferax sp. Leaf267 TaxID=1736316 RepID=UPI0012E2E440|nr:hypothetical protein [Pseudorhodoferax sp. Leaf267]